nr:cell envelope protein SmpA [uncultured Pseudomonas sp.]
MRKLLVTFVACLMMVGCAGNRIDYNRQSINLALGMSKADVQGIMGMPRRTDVNEDRERWIFWNPVMVGFTPMDNESLAQDRLVVTFKEGKVARWGNQTLAEDITEASQKSMESSMKILQQAQPPKQ